MHSLILLVCFTAPFSEMSPLGSCGQSQNQVEQLKEDLDCKVKMNSWVSVCVCMYVL